MGKRISNKDTGDVNTWSRGSGKGDRVTGERRKSRGVIRKDIAVGAESQIIAPSRLRKDFGLYFKCGGGSLEVSHIGLCFVFEMKSYNKIYLLKISQSSGFCINLQHYLILQPSAPFNSRTLITPPLRWLVSSYSQFSSRPQSSLICLLLLRISRSWTFHTNRIIQCVNLCVWLLSHYLVFSELIHSLVFSYFHFRIIFFLWACYIFF